MVYCQIILYKIAKKNRTHQKAVTFLQFATEIISVKYKPNNKLIRTSIASLAIDKIYAS